MSQSATIADARYTAARERPPSGVSGPWAWARRNLFGSWLSTAVTLVLGYLILRFVISFVSWAFVHAIWSVPYNAQGVADTGACQLAKGVGACWAIVADKYRLILFGRYPYQEQWRPAICVALFIMLYVVSAIRWFWRKELALIWIATLVVIGILMWGGVFGMPLVTEDFWGGLPLTLILATFGLAFGFPLGVLVALGRRSTSMPAVKVICVIYVELIRGVPLIAVLFMASVMFPLFMPEGVNIDKLLRAQIAVILFSGAYLAEVVRGGLQALPKGQAEAADALGLSYWKKTGFIILPQALRLVIPPLVNTFIGFFKDTSLVLIVGLFDLLAMGKVALTDPPWQSFSTEVYLMLAVIYIAFCLAMSKYSRGLERELSRAHRR
jgi:general L-amino acid transport system permease protein